MERKQGVNVAENKNIDALGSANAASKATAQNGVDVVDGVASAEEAASLAAQQSDFEGEEEKKKKKKRLLIVLLFLLLVAVGIIVWLLFFAPKDDGFNPDPNVQIGALSSFGDLDKIVDEGLLTFSINSTPVFDNGSAEGNLLIENPEVNNNRFTVTITRNDTGDEVYKSGYIDPGQYIENAKLSVPLPKGVYPCTALFQTYKLSDNKAIGQAAAEVNIAVLH